MRYAFGAQELGAQTVTVSGTLDPIAAHDADVALVGRPIDVEANPADGSRLGMPARVEQESVLADVEHSHRRLDHDKTIGIDRVRRIERAEPQAIAQRAGVNYRCGLGDHDRQRQAFRAGEDVEGERQARSQTDIAQRDNERTIPGLDGHIAGRLEHALKAMRHLISRIAPATVHYGSLRVCCGSRARPS